VRELDRGRGLFLGNQVLVEQDAAARPNIHPHLGLFFRAKPACAPVPDPHVAERRLAGRWGRALQEHDRGFVGGHGDRILEPAERHPALGHELGGSGERGFAVDLELDVGSREGAAIEGDEAPEAEYEEDSQEETHAVESRVHAEHLPTRVTSRRVRFHAAPAQWSGARYAARRDLSNRRAPTSPPVRG
jgi:hypothetical protein